MAGYTRLPSMAQNIPEFGNYIRTALGKAWRGSGVLTPSEWRAGQKHYKSLYRDPEAYKDMIVAPSAWADPSRAVELLSGGGLAWKAMRAARSRAVIEGLKRAPGEIAKFHPKWIAKVRAGKAGLAPIAPPITKSMRFSRGAGEAVRTGWDWFKRKTIVPFQQSYKGASLNASSIGNLVMQAAFLDAMEKVARGAITISPEAARRFSPFDFMPMGGFGTIAAGGLRAGSGVAARLGTPTAKLLSRGREILGRSPLAPTHGQGYPPPTPGGGPVTKAVETVRKTLAPAEQAREVASHAPAASRSLMSKAIRWGAGIGAGAAAAGGGAAAARWRMRSGGRYSPMQLRRQ